MTSLKLIQSEISRFLASPDPEVLCISGEWGIGKTYVWQDAVNQAAANTTIKPARYSYVSLFGVNSLEGLKLTIFENVEFLSARKHRFSQGVNRLFRSAKASAELGADLLKVEGLAKRAGPLFFSLVRNQLVCIDDLERRGHGLRLADVMGLVSFLKEQRKCKVVLLLNEGELGKGEQDEYAVYFEKVVDVGLAFAPLPQESVRIALKNWDELDRLIEQNCVALGISNIRVIRKVERLVRVLHHHISHLHENVVHQAVHTLTLLGWSKFQPKTAPPLNYIRGVNEFSRLIKNEKLPVEVANWDKLLREYKFIALDDFDRSLLSGVENGFFDTELVVSAARTLDQSLRDQARSNAFASAWRVFHESFDNDEPEFVRNLEASFRENVRIISPRDLSSTVALLKNLFHDELANTLLHFYMEQRQSEPKDFWDLGKHPFAEDISDTDVIAEFNSRLAAMKSVKLDPIDVLQHIADNQSWNPEQLAALASLTVDEFYGIFKSLKGRHLNSLVHAALTFSQISPSTSEMLSVGSKARAALIRIGRESAYNALRVRKYGIHASDLKAG